MLAVLMLVSCTQETQTPISPTPTPAPDLKTPTPTRKAIKTPTPTSVQPTPTPTRSILVEEKDLQGQKLTFWHPYRGEEQEKLNQMVSEFNRTNAWGITVRAVSQAAWGVLDEKMRQLSTDSVRPDIVVGYNTQALQWDLGGWLLIDQSRYISDPVWGLPQAEVKGFYPALWAQDFVPDGMLAGKPSPGGKRLGLPWYNATTLLFYNASLGRELGFTHPPQTTSELKAQVCAAAQAAGKTGEGNTPSTPGSGGWLVTDEASLLSSLIFAFGGELARPDRTGYQFDTPEARQAVQYLYQLYAAGCIWRDADVNSLQAFGERKALLVAVSSAEIGSAPAIFAEMGFKDGWLVLPFYSPTGQPVVNVYGPALLITQSDPARQLAAWLFVRWLDSPKNQALWAAVSGNLPSSGLAVQEMGAQNGPLGQALGYLPYTHSEPVYASWGYVRPAQAEALDFVFLPDRKSEDLFAILKTLDKLAAEIHSQWGQP